MIRTLATLVLAAVAMPSCPAQAASMDDFLARGYSIVHTTSLPGTFSGCRRGQSLTFADGTRFVCAGTGAATAYEPRVFLLRVEGEPPSVLIIGSQAFAGSLKQAGARSLGMSTTLAGADTAPAPSLNRIEAIQPIRSVDSMTATLFKPLEQAQPDPLPPKPRKAR